MVFLPPTAVGLAIGAIADAALGDPRRGHPVAGFGRAAAALERSLYADSRVRGGLYAVLCVGVTSATGALAQRVCRSRPWSRTALTAAATWAVLGGTSLAREGEAMAALLEEDDIEGARRRLGNLCARDSSGMSRAELCRASVESLAENASDAVVAPLLWGAVAGMPGLLGYRAVNTLDAMVGYLTPRHRRFGWAAARLDDVANLVPARMSVLVLAGAALITGDSGAAALRTAVRDGAAHPSPNAGFPEAAVAGALGIRLGGTNSYGGTIEHRPVLGEPGRAATVDDLRRTVRMLRVASAVSAVLAAALATATGRPTGRLSDRSRKEPA